MKMHLLLLVAIIIMAISALAGCAGWFTALNGEKLGRYTYIQRPAYVGYPIRTIPIWIDKNFGEADLLEIDRAVNSWNYVLNGYIKLQIVDTKFDMQIDRIVKRVRENGWLFMKIDGKSSLVPGPTDPHDWSIGFAERIGGNHLYLVRERLHNDWVYGVTMHEIGHLLGSPHIGNRLMYPRMTRSRYQCVDYDTMWTVAVYNGISPDLLNYCVDGVKQVDSKPADNTTVETISCPTDK